MNKKIFTGGQVVLPDSVVTASLVVEGEQIAGLLLPGIRLGSEYEEIDVSGKVLLPGVIDMCICGTPPRRIIARTGVTAHSALRPAGSPRSLTCR